MEWISPEIYLEIRSNYEGVIKQLQTAIKDAREMAEKCPIPKDVNLRAAHASDIVEGEILWYYDGDDGEFWQVVSEVHHPNDPYKAYTAEDGCRYGLDGAYIAIPEEVKPK